MSTVISKMNKEEFRKLLDEAGVSYKEAEEGGGGIFCEEAMIDFNQLRDSQVEVRALKMAKETKAATVAARRIRGRDARARTIMHRKNQTPPKDTLQRRSGN